MLRESLEPGARHATMLIEYRNLGDQDRFRFARREQADERSRASSGDHAEIPNAWVQIRREGNEFIGSSSTDGTKWTEVGRVTLDLSEHILAGIAATGRDSKPDEPFNPLVARVCQLDFVPSALRAKFRRGDCNNDGSVDISDATCALNWLFAGASELGCVAALNTNGDDDVNIADTVSLLNFLFGGGLAPVAPFRDCGTSELEADARLGCVTGCQ